MRVTQTSAYSLAERFIGLSEVEGVASNPAILAMLRLDAKWPEGDDVPWCSAFVNYIAWLLRLPRSKSLRARSWLDVGYPTNDPQRGFDVVVLARAGSTLDASVRDAPGHVGFYAGEKDSRVFVLGGNQSDSVSIASFDMDSLLDIRRLAT